MISTYHKAFLSELLLAQWVGSADKNNIPDTVRSLGIVVEDEYTLLFFVAERASKRFLHNFTENKQITLATSHPYTFEGYQYKGEVLEIRPSTAAEVKLQEAYMDVFSDGMAAFGLEKQGVTDMYLSQPTIAIRMTVNKIFDQTPKPNTGGEVHL